MSDDDVTEITCDGCTGASDWYCVKCWNGIMGQLRDADIERHALRAEVEDARVALGDAWQNDEIAKGIVRKCAWSKEDSEIQREAAKWREKRAVMQLEEVRATVERFREAQKATAEGWRHEVAEIAGLVGAPSHTHELAHFVQNVVNDRDAARQRVAELEQLLALRAKS
jgi:transcription initiation factor TFIIIB Brf1 subunit/transcription initiation factor TFIIB